jgi:hypothetical protein
MVVMGGGGLQSMLPTPLRACYSIPLSNPLACVVKHKAIAAGEGYNHDTLVDRMSGLDGD